MQPSSFFLRTKLLPPRAVSDLLERPRLTEKLVANVDAPITLVAADAGFGKTTLIADFLRQNTRPSVWYQLDHTDADPIVFLNYIAHGIRGIEPEFGAALIAYLAESSEDLVRFPERAADLLINEILMSIEQPFILVLDDYHHIGADTPVHKIVDRITQYAAEHLHLIITTRDLPPLAIMRRRAQAAALVITRDDLLFTDDEVRELFRLTLNVELKEEEIAEYRDRTHGWVTALQLVRQVVEKETGTGGSPQIDLSQVLQRSEKDIFDYFAEEVFARESEETQRLMLYLSLLESLPLEHCSRLFPDLRCSAALPELAQKNVFLTAAGEGSTEEYRFHPLFRGFLQRRLRSEIGQLRLNAERDRIAEIYLQSRQWELALPFLLDADNFARAAEVIAESGGDWIAAGAIISLKGFLDRIPDDVLETHPRALLYRAEIARLQGETELSTMVLNRAVALFKALDDPASEAEALHALASLARRRARYDEALGLLEKAEKLAPKQSETLLKCLNTRGLCLIGQGRWTEAELQFRHALDLAEQQSNEHYVRLIAHNLALAPGFRGDFAEALRWFYRIFRKAEGGRQFPQEAIGHLNVARLHLYRGEMEKVEEHLAKAVELAQLFNLRSLLPEIFETYANFYREKHDYPHAAEYYERSLNAYDDAGVDLANRELNSDRAMFYLQRGDTVRARGLLESLLEARKTSHSELLTKTALFALCRVDLVDGRTEGLVERITEILDFFQEQGQYFDEAQAAMLLAETLFALDRKPAMVPPMQRVLDLTARFDYDYWLRTVIRRNPALFEYEDVLDRLPPDLREELTGARAVPTAPALQYAEIAEIAAAVTDLTVKVLGPVDIYRDHANPFASDAWTTRRARDIFCFIATSKHRRVSKDVLIDTFWGEDDPSTIEKNFHPTISLIRKALNSRQSLKQNFVVFRDGAYHLNPQYSYSIDSEEFSGFIAAAETAKRERDDEGLKQNLESARMLYRGDFMDGSYERWAEEHAEQYREQYIRVLNGLAKIAVTDKQWVSALKYAEEILILDPYREDLHRLIMKVLSAQGKPASVKKHYDNMQALLKQELGIDPGAETKRLYRELMK